MLELENISFLLSVLIEVTILTLSYPTRKEEKLKKQETQKISN